MADDALVYSCNNYKELLSNTFKALKEAQGNQNYPNDQLIENVDVVRFHQSFGEKTEFDNELEQLYYLAMDFSDAMPDITNNKSALLDGYNGSIEAISETISMIRYRKGIFNDEDILKQACQYIQNAREIVDNLTKGVFQCMSDFRATKIPDGKETFKTIYDMIIDFLSGFQDDVEKTNGDIDQNIKNNVHQFYNMKLQPMINNAGLTEAVATYYQCNRNKSDEAGGKLKELLENVKDLLKNAVTSVGVSASTSITTIAVQTEPVALPNVESTNASVASTTTPLPADNIVSISNEPVSPSVTGVIETTVTPFPNEPVSVPILSDNVKSVSNAEISTVNNTVVSFPTAGEPILNAVNAASTPVAQIPSNNK